MCMCTYSRQIMQSKKIMASSGDVLYCIDCSKAQRHVFKVVTNFTSLYLMYDSGCAIRFTLTCFYSAIYLESFFYYNGVATTEGTGFWTPEANRT